MRGISFRWASATRPARQDDVLHAGCCLGEGRRSKRGEACWWHFARSVSKVSIPGSGRRPLPLWGKKDSDAGFMSLRVLGPFGGGAEAI